MGYARDYLARAGLAQRQIIVKSEKIDMLEAMINRCTQSFSDMPHGAYDPLRREKALCRLIDMKEELEEAIKGFVQAEGEVRDLISEVESDSHRELLERRYLNGEDWVQVAEGMGKGVRQIYRLHDAAVKEAEEILRHDKDRNCGGYSPSDMRAGS